MMLVNASQTRFRFLQRRFENMIHDPALFIAEQRFERVNRSAKTLINNANHPRHIGPGEGLAQLPLDLAVGILICALSHSGTERVIAHVQDGEGKLIDSKVMREHTPAWPTASCILPETKVR